MYQHAQSFNSSSYSFITDFGITYVVEFSDAAFYFDSSSSISQLIEAVAFYPIGQKGKLDLQIKETICNIIIERCRNNNVAVVFVCDQSGGLSRSKVFKEWEYQLNNGFFHFQPAEIEHPTGFIFTGMIVEKSKANASMFLSEFVSAMKDITVKLN